MQGVDPRLAQAIAFARAAYAVPEVKAAVDCLTLLSGTSAAFWILSKVLGRVALALHGALDRALADLFAVGYNLALAVLYASVIASAVALGGAGGARFLWSKAAGFLFVYVTLRSVNSDREGKVDEYGLLGYVGGVASYIVFLLRPGWLAHPVFTHLYDVVLAVMQAGIARALTALAVVRALFVFARVVARGIIGSFQWLGRKLDRKAVASAAVFLV